MSNRHLASVCESCSAPMSAQNSSCWRCNTRRADAGPPAVFEPADGKTLLRFGATVAAGPAAGRRGRAAPR